jgi:hypothetical protein
MSTRELFDFVTDVSIPDDGVDAYLDEIQERIEGRGAHGRTEEEKVLDEVFMSAFIPQRLDQISMADAEKDIKRAAQGEDVLHRKITGMNETMTGAAVGRDAAHADENEPDEDAEAEAEASDEEGSEADSDEGEQEDDAFKEWLQTEEEQLALLRQALAVVSSSTVRPRRATVVHTVPVRVRSRAVQSARTVSSPRLQHCPQTRQTCVTVRTGPAG